MGLRGLVILGLFLGSSLLEAQSKVYQAEEIFPRVMVDDHAVYMLESVELYENETVVFSEPSRVFVQDLKFHPNAGFFIDGSEIDLMVSGKLESEGGGIQARSSIRSEAGADGDVGVDGEKAQDGLRGSAGSHGSNATDGGHGGHGSSIRITNPHLSGDLILITRGGDGGHGGRGGSGGKGGVGFSGEDARILYEFRGLDSYPLDMLVDIGMMIGVPVVGQVLAIMKIFNGLRIGDGFDGYDGGAGGNAGNGGSGGDGGDAGDIFVMIGKRDPQTEIRVNARGGLGGVGGPAGVPGVGGPGGEGGRAGGLWSKNGKPGKAGATGEPGLRGERGMPGQAGRVALHETGSPKFVECYISFERMRDLGVDDSVAVDFFLRCIP